MKKKTIYSLIVLLMMACLLPGQSGQTGQIKGTVATPDGSLLPGVNVELTSPSMVVAKMMAVTNENGTYRFLGLAPGNYKLVYSLDGMQTVVREGIVVNVSKTSTLNVKMEMGKIEENIVITGMSPTVDRQSTAKTSNIDNETINSVPSGRSVASFFALAPGVTGNSAHGSSTRENTYNIDGVNLNDPTVGTQGVYMSADIMEEVSVQAGGISAEYGSATGAVVNVVTKSGGDVLSGSVSAYYEHEKFRADNTKGTPLESQGTTGNKYDLEAGMTLGGALIKSKLWFFASMSYNESEQYISGYPWRAKGTEATQIPYDQKKYYPYLKLTYQPSQDDKLYISYQYTDRKLNHRDASAYRTEESTRIQETPAHIFNAQWSHTFGSTFFMNAKVGIVRKGFDMVTKSNEPRIYNYGKTRFSGSYGYSDYNDRNRANLKIDGTLFLDEMLGQHELKFGATYEMNEAIRNLVYAGANDPHNPGYKLYQYRYNENAAGDLVPYRAYSARDYKSKREMTKIGLFVQDTWNLSNNFTFNIGVRADIQRGIIPAQAEGTGVQYFAQQFFGTGRPFNVEVAKDMTVVKWNDIAPRFGAIYDIFQNGSTLIKATWGRYYSSLMLQNISAMNPNKGSSYYGDFDPASGLITNYAGGSRPNPAAVNYKDTSMVTPYTDELTVSVERELFEDWSVGFRYIRKWSKKMLENVDASALDMDKLVNNGELVWKNYEQVTVRDPYNGKQLTFWNKTDTGVESDYYTINPAGAERDYKGFELSLNKRFSKGYSLSASYVYAKSEGLIGTDFDETTSNEAYYNSPNAHVNAYGSLETERRHYFKLIGLVKGPWGINIGLKFRMYSGGRYTRTVRSDQLNLDLNQGKVSILAEERGTRSLPAIKKLDLRLEKAFTFSRFTLRVFADVFNVFNEAEATSVWSSSTDNNIYQFGEMRSITYPRTVRFGGKFEF